LRRIATCLRNERPEPDEGTVAVPVDEGPWGFVAVDGLPDLETAPPYRREPLDDREHPQPSDGASPCGFDDEVIEELARIRRRAREIGAGGRNGRGAAGRRALTIYEVEVCAAMTARRDAALRLRQILADDVDRYESGMACVRAGMALDIMVPAIGGSARQTVSDATSVFEAARHRFRLALVAVAMDNGISAAKIGEGFGFSRQLASRYLKVAREQWPELSDRSAAMATVA